MKYLTMHQSKSFDAGTDLYPIYSPTSPASSPRSMAQRHSIGRRRKLASESIASDLFRRSLRHPSPDSVDARMFVMPEEGATSSPDEDPDLSHSTRSMGARYLPLTTKDRLKSASLEWTLSNGAVTPRATHYHTHPPLDFKSLKEKLEQLTGSRDDVSKKLVSGISGHERRRWVSTTLAAPMTSTSSAGDGSSTAGAGAHFFQNVPYVTLESLSRTTSEEADSKPIFRMNSINLPGNKSDSDSSDAFQWSDLAQHVAQNDGKLQKILQRHYQERDDLKKEHELQWKELRQRISESAPEDLERNVPQLPDSQQHCAIEDGKDQLSLFSSDVDLMQRPHADVSDCKETVGLSLDINAAANAQPELSRVDEVDGNNNAWRDVVQSVKGIGSPSAAYEVPQQLSAQFRSQLTTPSMAMLQRQMENLAYQQAWRHLVDRTMNQFKVDPPVLRQMEPLEWYRHLEMLQRLQAPGLLEQRIQQLVPQQVSLLEAIRHAQSQSHDFRCHRFPNHPCRCVKPCIQEHSYSAGPYSTTNLNGRSGISYSPNYAPAALQLPSPTALHQSPCSEVSSYYRPETNRLYCGQNQMACLLGAGNNNNDLLPASPVTMTPQPMSLFSHLVARQSPLRIDASHPSSLRPSPLQGLSLLSPIPDLQFPATYAMPPDIRQLIFSSLNPFAT